MGRNNITLAADGRGAGTQFPVNLIGGSKKYEWLVPATADRIQHVESTFQIYFKIQARIGDRGGHSDLRGKMIDVRGMGHGLFHLLRVANIANRDLKPSGVSCRFLEPFQVVMYSGAR